MDGTVLTAVVLACSVFGGMACTQAAERSEDKKSIIPTVSNFSFNDRWVNPKILGKTFWITDRGGQHGEEKAMAQLGLLGRLAHYGEPTWEEGRRTRKGWQDTPEQRSLYDRIEAGRLPVLGPQHKKGAISLDGEFLRYALAPSKNDIASIVQQLGDGFLGYRPFNEWGNATGRAVRYCTNQRLGQPTEDWLSRPGTFAVGLACVQFINELGGPVDSRRAFVDTAERLWRAFSAPYDYQVYAMDGAHYWAMQWPAIWGARAIITENRCPGRSVVQHQAFTRAAGRMGKIPWGYYPAYDWFMPVVPDIRTHVRRPDTFRQKARGWLNLQPSFYRRTTYYMCMGGAAIIMDEAGHLRYVDLDGDGNYRLSWYGWIWEEVMDFADRHPDRGTPYTPIGVLLSWDNGFEIDGDKAFNRFPYNDGEQMTRGFFHDFVYPFKRSGNNPDQDMFGPTPYGDVFDPLRMDTPNGPLPMELLENYKVLFCVGEQNIDPSVARRLEEYVSQGGVLILNVKQLSPEVNSEFTGVTLGDRTESATRVKSVLDNVELASERFQYTPLLLGSGAEGLYKCGDDVLVSRSRYGKGLVLLVGAHWMLASAKMRGPEGDAGRTILPLARDMMERIVESALPFRVTGDHVKERVLYQVNRKGEGWVVSLYNNSGRETFRGNAPEKVYPEKQVVVELQLSEGTADVVEWTKHQRLAPIRTRGLPMLRVEIDPGDLRIVEFQPSRIPPVRMRRPVNLALGRLATASSSVEGVRRDGRGLPPGTHGPDRAVDGKVGIFDAWWSDGNCPEWLQIDLGCVKTIQSIRTVMMWSEDNRIFPRIYQYYVEVSRDGSVWKRVVDETKNMSPADRRGHHRHFDPVEARYVRITVTHNTARTGGQIVEFEVYGDEVAIETFEWNNAGSGR